jgi:hypothetical protein
MRVGMQICTSHVSRMHAGILCEDICVHACGVHAYLYGCMDACALYYVPLYLCKYVCLVYPPLLRLVREMVLQGVTAYQADYSMAAVTLRAEGSPLQPANGGLFNLPMASLEGQPGALTPLL